MARNTTLIRSNYLWDESARDLRARPQTVGGPRRDLDYPILFSQCGVLNLAHSLQDVRDSVRRVEANKLNGIDAEWVGPRGQRAVPDRQRVRPTSAIRCWARTYQPRAGIAKHDYVAWGFARRADEAGIDLIQGCEVTGFSTDGDRVTGVRTTRGDIAAGRCSVRGRTHLDADRHARHPHSAAEPSPAGAGVRAARAGPPDHRDVQRRARLRLAGAQGRAGDGRRRGLLQRVRPARRVPHHRTPDGRRRRAFPRLRPRASAAQLGGHRRRLPRRLPHRRTAPATRTCSSTAVGAPAVSKPPRGSAGAWPTPSPTTRCTRTSRRSASTVSSPAPSSTNTAPPASRTEPRRRHHATHRLPVVRTA